MGLRFYRKMIYGFAFFFSVDNNNDNDKSRANLNPDQQVFISFASTLYARDTN